MKELLESGVHFGHQTKRWNPKMKEYIFGERNGIHIIDLQKTLKMFKEAARFISDCAAEGKSVLFVGTKRQAQEAVAEEAKRCSMFYVNSRWLGGLLTNWQTVQKSIRRLKELEQMANEEGYEGRAKKEVARLERERKRLDQNLAGISLHEARGFSGPARGVRAHPFSGQRRRGPLARLLCGRVGGRGVAGRGALHYQAGQRLGDH